MALSDSADAGFMEEAAKKGWHDDGCKSCRKSSMSALGLLLLKAHMKKSKPESPAPPNP